ncbi:hypothetical protein niasHS_002555 [Heterodera schachtii]|uniref:Phospholipase A2 n=1 Tax=Heterodera schachtii TaxID=97005 RepID=A0ABD2KKS0_HETSC
MFLFFLFPFLLQFRFTLPNLLNFSSFSDFLIANRINLSLVGSAEQIKQNDQNKSFIGLWNIEQMSRCSLNRSAELTYNGYGCFCGIGGNGTALDGIDSCCQMHDLCYDFSVFAGFCSPINRYISHYDWQCRNWDGSATAQTIAKCDEAKNERMGGCGRAICRCDQ